MYTSVFMSIELHNHLSSQFLIHSTKILISTSSSLNIYTMQHSESRTFIYDSLIIIYSESVCVETIHQLLNMTRDS